MVFLKSELINNHFYLQQLEKGKLYKISCKHNQLAKFIIEILDASTHEILSRPNEYSITCIPDVPYTITLKAYNDGILAIHYDTDALEKAQWTMAYDIIVEEVV